VISTENGFSITGTKEVQKILDEIAPKYARNLMRATIHGVASTIAKDARANAPKDSGNLKKSIKSKRRKSRPDNPISEVIVLTGKGGVSAFYWLFLERGTRTGIGEHRFIANASEKARANFETVLTEQFGKKLEQALRREAKKKAKT